VSKEAGLLPENQEWCGEKGDTTKASVPVNSPFTLEELVHMIDVSANNKYDTDLAGITRTLTNDLRSSLESELGYKQDVNNNLHRQVRSMVQQVLGESREKRDTNTRYPLSILTWVQWGWHTGGLHLWQLGPGVGEQWLTQTFSSRICLSSGQICPIWGANMTGHQKLRAVKK
jgi:hypothetical protein